MEGSPGAAGRDAPPPSRHAYHAAETTNHNTLRMLRLFASRFWQGREDMQPPKKYRVHAVSARKLLRDRTVEDVEGWTSQVQSVDYAVFLS